MNFLEESMVKFGVDADDAESAIEAAGKLLLDEGLVEQTYIDAMKHAYIDNGPYFVLAPQIAIPHARPEDGVKEASVSFVQLKKPVVFGHSANDPVRLVFGLGASTSDEHLTLLKKLTGILNDTNNIATLKTATSYEDIKNILELER
nr:PTS sugar transporter subunit IIA [Lentibacillus daqui]